MKIIKNPNKQLVIEIQNKLKTNGGYCPCSLTKNEDTKCMCKEFREQITNGVEGACHCGLWVAQ